ncbi:MutS-related protein [Ferruginibacter sp. SUN106]|uniref:MutS-related protein n=1 Tax=Ferruginibacter sp. SUN106 TaxID=2978348 RepID=UPI003D361859
MQADKTTLTDLSIFNTADEQAVFNYLDFTRTVGGKEWLRFFLSKPFDTIKAITETQHTIQKFLAVQQQWGNTLVSNGTIMVIEKFYETGIEEIPHNPGFISSFYYSIFSAPDFSFIRYSVKHFADFFTGMQQAATLLQADDNPTLLQTMLEQIKLRLNKPGLQAVLQKEDGKDFSKQQLLQLGHFLKRRYKQEALDLIEIYSKLDAYYSMACACDKYQLSFPSFTDTDKPEIKAKQLFHPLLPTPVAYDVDLNQQQNFLFLTGANMGGKSTFIKAVGVAVYLAHTGMGVPAQQMELSLFDGLLSNINVVDNLVQGESYFFNEVQRIRKTVDKISDGKKWLILIDELFKGTNVQDAMKCSSTVIEGLLKIKNSLFILSTHLYEIGEDLKKFPNIQFKYFETAVTNGQLYFSYQLKEGISNDRLGYLILKREGVVEMLEKL